MIKITDEIREEVNIYLQCENGNYTDELYSFYYRCKQANMDYADADRYAILNTLFNYDIGMENAKIFAFEPFERSGFKTTLRRERQQLYDRLRKIQICRARAVALPSWQIFETSPDEQIPTLFVGQPHRLH